MKNLGMIRLAIRGFAGKTPVFEDYVDSAGALVGEQMGQIPRRSNHERRSRD